MSGREGDFDIDLNDPDAYENEYDDYDYDPYFVGPCTCNHEQSQHTYGECSVPDCTCVAGWEE